MVMVLHVSGPKDAAVYCHCSLKVILFIIYYYPHSAILVVVLYISACHKPALYENGCTHWTGFWCRCFPWL